MQIKLGGVTTLVELGRHDKEVLERIGRLEAMAENGNNTHVVLIVTEKVNEGVSDGLGFRMAAYPGNVPLRETRKVVIYFDRSKFSRLTKEEKESSFETRCKYDRAAIFYYPFDARLEPGNTPKTI